MNALTRGSFTAVNEAVGALLQWLSSLVRLVVRAALAWERLW
jgi:hypothetical protein